MSIYYYEAVTSSDEEIQGYIDAWSVEEARSKIETKGTHVRFIKLTDKKTIGDELTMQLKGEGDVWLVRRYFSLLPTGQTLTKTATSQNKKFELTFGKSPTGGLLRKKSDTEFTIQLGGLSGGDN